MYQTLRTAIWFALVGAGALTVLLTFIISSDVRAVLVAAAVIAVWVAYGIFSSWFFGLKRRLTAHMKRPIDRVTFVTKDVGASRLADYVRTLEDLCERQSGLRLGADASVPLSQMKTGNIAVLNVDWNTIEAEDGNLVSVPTNSVYFLEHENHPLVVRLFTPLRADVFEHEDARGTGKGSSLELCAESLEDANRIIPWLSGQTSEHSIYRRRMLQVASPTDGTVGQTIRISKPPDALRESIILPEAVITLLERLVHGRARYAKQLARFGHKTRLGILLHGPPGTGKTLVTRYLVGGCRQHTIIVPSDMAIETLRESFRLARYLQPSLLVIEDVDLLAPRRDLNSRVDGLQELLNQLDGLAATSDTIVILSTNRPEILEPALASRPGRISQAVDFPLPDEEGRIRLLELFLRDATTDSRMILEWAERTEGASPAFLEELCKRAILLASERQQVDDDAEAPSSVDVQFGDLHNAIHELVLMGGEMTSQALGFPDAGKR